jgi:signal transduction histidine kinase
MIHKSQLLASFNGITDIILIMDNDYNIVFTNKAFCEFYNIKDPDKISGQKCYKIVSDKTEPCSEFECPTVKSLKSGVVETVEKEMRGEIIKYWTYPVFNGDNKIENIVSYSRIISEQKKIEQELIHSEKLKGIGRLAAGVAHELNNPLCSILGFSGLLKESIDEKDPNFGLVTDLIESVTQAKKLVEGLLDYSRQSVTNTDFFSIRDIIEHTITLSKYKLRMNKITINTEYEKNLPKVKIDLQKTVQAFLNIIINAIDVSQENGTIIIRAQRQSDQYVSITVSDNGCGIPEENISQVFIPFFTTKEVGEGTGLGLSIAYNIIEQQNGKIRVESELGKGSVFEILLPLDN